MKRIYLSLLLCLAYLLASAQEPLNGDSLASDFRYLVKELAATHPDPYSGFEEKYSSTNKLSIWRTSYAGLPVRNRPFLTR